MPRLFFHEVMGGRGLRNEKYASISLVTRLEGSNETGNGRFGGATHLAVVNTWKRNTHRGKIYTGYPHRWQTHEGEKHT